MDNLIVQWNGSCYFHHSTSTVTTKASYVCGTGSSAIKTAHSLLEGAVLL